MLIKEFVFLFFVVWISPVLATTFEDQDSSSECLATTENIFGRAEEAPETIFATTIEQSTFQARNGFNWYPPTPGVCKEGFERRHPTFLFGEDRCVSLARSKSPVKRGHPNDSTDPFPVPLPAALPLMIGGLSALVFFGWGRRKDAN